MNTISSASTRQPIPAEAVARLFTPRSVALIGATDRSGWSWATFENLAPDRFSGDVHLVNRRGGTVHGVQAYARVADLPDGVDLAYLMVGTHTVLEVVEEVAARGIRSVVILTAGFGEAGEEGEQLERDVLDVALRHGMTILGPNGNGFVNVAGRVAPYGLAIPKPPLPGSIGVVLQSGGLASIIMDLAAVRQVGLSLLVSMGNELMLSLTDVVRYLVHDPATKVIGLFIESIRDPEEFRRVAREALRAGKPIVAMKAGRSDVGARVAKAHTGSLVGDDVVISAVFEELGVIRVDSLEDLIVTTELLAEGPELSGNRFGLVSSSGGANELIADRAEEVGILLPDFAPETELALSQVLPEFGSVRNPVDVTGLAVLRSDLLQDAVTIVASDPGIDALMYWGDLPRHASNDPGARAESIEYHRRQAAAFEAASKPVIVLGTAFTDITDDAADISRESGYPRGLGGIHHGLTAVGRALRWYAQRDSLIEPAPRADVDPVRVDAGPGETFAEHRASELLRELGVPMVPSRLVSAADDAVLAAEEFGYPVVVKLSADDVAHKSDIGGVRIGLSSPSDVRDAFTDVIAAGARAGARDSAALVQPQRSEGIELIVGVLRDPSWGLVLAVGLGGVWVEVFRDSVLHTLPAHRSRVRAGLTELRAAALLGGVRGAPAADLDAITDVVMLIAEAAERLGDRLVSLEVNPLRVRGNMVEALDALITWGDA